MTNKVLIINDHIVMRDGLSAVINRSEGLTTVGALDSSTYSRDLIQNLEPDVLMLDLQVMGSIFQIANEAKEIRPEIKILMTTNVFLPEHQRQVERVGAHGLVSSFEAEEQILLALETVLSGGQFMQPNETAAGMVQKQRQALNKPMNHPLSPREVDVLCCVAKAMTAKEVARDLHISVKTVDRHKANIMNKLSMRSQIELARYAIRNGFVEA